MMEMLVGAVGAVGFPIVVTLYILVVMNKTVAENTKVIQKTNVLMEQVLRGK